MAFLQRLLVVGMVAGLASTTLAAPIQLDISSGFTYDAIMGPGEYTYAHDTLGVKAHSVYGEHTYIATQGYDLVIAETTYTTVSTDGVPADGVVTAAASGTVYHMASLTGNATVGGDMTQAADPSTLAVQANAMVVMSSHNINTGMHIISASATLPIAQQGCYEDINFLISSSAQSHETSQMEIYADYADGSRQLLWSGFEDSPKMADNAVTDEWRPAITFNSIYNDSSGDLGAVENHRGTYSMYEFITPLDLDETKTLVGVTVEDNNPDRNWFARGVAVFGATATPVPEPATMALLAGGALALLRRRK